ncbi:MAG: hypothetical protein GMKNLPBB_01943 [Myxococcota bacterium]|nr:hypothetical protein [Myxococcota bacterium]
MLDLPRLQRLRLTPRPFSQWLIANTMLTINYHLIPGVDIRLEGLENLPPPPVIFAMNHTDRYNYWPFQYKLYRTTGRYTATWVKGKYYEHPFMAAFMQWANNIPTVSWGYLITKDFISTMKRRPTDREYEVLRGAVDAAVHGREAPYPGEAPQELAKTPRNILGLDFDPAREGWPQLVARLHAAMMRRFNEINRQTCDEHLDLLIFPQGTRSVRLPKGHIGISQVALAHPETVVPVGCNGSDKVYPGSSPWARRGRIVYRIGKPITVEEMKPFIPEPPFTPFLPADEDKHRERFQKFADLVMERINLLLDPQYQSGDSQSSDGVQGSHRFV